MSKSKSRSASRPSAIVTLSAKEARRVGSGGFTRFPDSEIYTPVGQGSADPDGDPQKDLAADLDAARKRRPWDLIG